MLMAKKKKHICDLGKLSAICIYLGVAVVCFIHRNKITIESIVSYTPENAAMAAAVMLALFTLKGCTVFVNGNILYAACGVLFPLPAAIAVNTAGSIIMTTIPFFIGRKSGTTTMDALAQKYKKLEMARNAPRYNELLFTLFMRILGILPCEPVGMYLGSCGLRYSKYIVGTMIGLAPAIVAYAIIGEYAADPMSPQFIISAIFQAGTTLCSLAAALMWKLRRRANQEREKSCKKRIS